MIELVILYIVLGASGAYGLKKGTDVYLHLDDNNVKRYEQCIKVSDDVSECKDFE